MALNDLKTSKICKYAIVSLLPNTDLKGLNLCYKLDIETSAFLQPLTIPKMSHNGSTQHKPFL